MTEWNSGQPNDYGGESLLMAASYAAWQDWAGIFIFDYHSSGVYDRDKIEGFFSIDSHPAKMASAPAAALLFRRGDVTPGEQAVNLTIPHDTFWNEVVALPDGTSAAPFIKTWKDAGAWRGAPLESRVYAAIGDTVFPTATFDKITDVKQFDTDTGETSWDGAAGTYLMSSPRSKLIAGFWGGRIADADELKIAMAPSTPAATVTAGIGPAGTAAPDSSNFAVFALSSLDGVDIVASKSLLLTATGKAENVNMTWNADRNSIGNGWGTGPTQMEGIIATVRLVTTQKEARVWALDETGQQRTEVPAMWKNGVLEWTISPQYKTVWYQIAS
jgi:hypothetical protein